MANDPTPTSETHATVPVLHPESGEVHDIAVPFGTDIADLHQALSDYYMDANRQPTEAGALENQDSFREAARNAITQTESSGIEHGFVVNEKGIPVPAPMGVNHSMQLTIQPGDSATFHAHPGNASLGYSGKGPSPNDIQLSKDTHVPFYVSTRDGLFMVRPSDGKVIQVFDKGEWAKKNKSK